MPTDDVADRVLERMAPLTLGPPLWLRVVLALAAVIQMAIAVPWLVGSDPMGLLGNAEASHLTRDGAFGMAIGIAGAITAWRHRYALAAAIVAGAILVIQFGTGLIDRHADRVAMWVETSHLLMLVITALIVAAARPARALGRRQNPTDELSDGLRLVGPASDD